MTGSIAVALAAPPPRGAPSDAAPQGLVAGLAQDMLAGVRAQAARDLGVLGAARPDSAALAGIGSHFEDVLWQLLGAHARDQGRIWQASRPGFGAGWAIEHAVASTEFAAHMRHDGWGALLERLPRLEALVCEVVALEISATSILLSRAARDAPTLAGRFGSGGGGGGDPGPLSGVSLGLSDPHNGRRTVAALSFRAGLHVLYKPRPVAMEAGLSSTIDWLRRRGGLDLPAGLAVLPCAGYGWCEFVDGRPCSRAEDVDLYFRRLGALAVVLGALAATDCHAENFIARGAEPVLVDGETLLHPRMLASPTFSLLETEIVPSRITGPAGQRIDYPGFDGPSPAAQTDGRSRPNLPRWKRRVHHLGDHRRHFDEGVRSTRQTLRTLADELTDADGPLAVLARRPARVVLRPTSVYAALLAHLSSASALASDDGGLPRLERELSRYQDPVLAPGVWRAVQRIEIAALARTDVPYFLADTTTGDLRSADGTLLASRAVQPVLGNLAVVVAQIVDGPWPPAAGCAATGASVS